MSKTGFFLVARGSLAHARFKPKGAFSAFEAWVWLIEAAAHSDCEVAVMNGTQREIIPLKAGQLTYSIRYLAKAWLWSPNRVQRFLDVLKTDRSVATQTDTPQTVITLCNWEKYQKPFDQADTQTNTQTDTQSNTNKKELERKKIYALPENGFADWYALYPKKKNPKAAQKAYSILMRSGVISESLLLQRTKAFAASWTNEPKARLQYCPYPSTWLNAGGYASEPDDGGGEKAPAPIDPRSFTDDQWSRRLSHFQQTQEWMDAWGPKPGAPGCLVHSHLLASQVLGPRLGKSAATLTSEVAA